MTIELEKKDAISSGEPEWVSNDIYVASEGSSNYINMEVGEIRRIEAFRVTQTVLSSTSSDFTEPEMKYEIISGEDCIEKNDNPSTSAPGREFCEITAKKEGVAVIKVTYGDLKILASSDVNSYTPEMKGYYAPPIDEANTGIMIVNIGGSSGDIQTGIEQTDYDTIYFTKETILPNGKKVEGDDHATYTFKPTNGKFKTKVRVREPIHYHDGDWGENDWDKEGWTSYTADKNGEYCIDLKEGRNIVEISSGGDVVYKVIMAKAVTVHIDNMTRSGELLSVGDDVSISFDGLELPIYKMSAIYNPGYPKNTWVQYRLNSDETIKSEGTQYGIDEREANAVTFKLSRTGKFVLDNGQIFAGHLGSALGSHLNIPLKGFNKNMNASTGVNDPYFCILPDIIFSVPPVAKAAASPAAGGRVSAEKLKEDEEAGTATWKLTAKAKSGYTFAGWALKSAPNKIVSTKAAYQVTLSDNVEYIALFEPKKITKSSLKYTATGKKTAAFTGTSSKNAKSVKVPKTVKSGGVTYQVTSIEKNAFKGNKKVTSAAIGDNVKTVGDGAFSNCKKLKKVTIGKGVVTIGKNAFAKLKKGCVITISSKKLKTVKAGFGKGTRKLTVKVPKKKLKTYRRLFKKFKNVTVKAK